MRSINLTSILLLAQSATLILAAAGSACSNGIYAILAPLETYAPAESYCASHYPGTTTVTVTASTVAKVKRAKTSKSTSTSSKTTLTKATTTTRQDAKASQWSSLLSQASAVVSTFCSCAGYPATTTTTTTPTPTATAYSCTNGVFKQSGTSNCYQVQCNTYVILSDNIQGYPYTSSDACFQDCTAQYCGYEGGSCYGGDTDQGSETQSGSTFFSLVSCPAGT